MPKNEKLSTSDRSLAYNRRNINRGLNSTRTQGSKKNRNGEEEMIRSRKSSRKAKPHKQGRASERLHVQTGTQEAADQCGRR